MSTRAPSRRSILIVEDDVPTRVAMMHLLEMEGFVVRGASNGAEALALLERDRPDVVLSDVTMPVMGGEALVQALRERAGPPVLLMTAHALIDAEAAERIGAAGVVHKPVDLDELLARVAQVLAPPNPA